MMRRLDTNRIFWLVVVIIALIMALVGVAKPEIYDPVVSPEIMPGVFSQDLMTIMASIIILFWIVRIKEKEVIKQMVILGILGYFFYGMEFTSSNKFILYFTFFTWQYSDSQFIP